MFSWFFLSVKQLGPCGRAPPNVEFRRSSVWRACGCVCLFIYVRADSSFPKWCSAEVVRMTRFRLAREMRCGRSDLFRVYCLPTCIRPFVWLRAMWAGALPLISHRVCIVLCFLLAFSPTSSPGASSLEYSNYLWSSRWPPQILKLSQRGS